MVCVLGTIINCIKWPKGECSVLHILAQTCMCLQRPCPNEPVVEPVFQTGNLGIDFIQASCALLTHLF